jgi:ribosomal protein S18 acetylase RimI-like enzyme
MRSIYAVGVNFEELDESFIDETVALWREAELTRPWNDPYEDFRRAVGGDTSAVLGALEAGGIVASVMVGVDGHRGWVYYLAVANDYRRRGLGTQLMHAAESWIAQHGAPKIQLMVRETNLQVVEFYEKLGYENAHTLVLGRWIEAPS